MFRLETLAAGQHSTMRVMTIEQNATNYPSVELAYDFVLPSYQMLATRFEAADTRVTSFLTLVASVTLAAPLFAKTVRPDSQFSSPLFIAGVICFLGAIAVGVWGR